MNTELQITARRQFSSTRGAALAIGRPFLIISPLLVAIVIFLIAPATANGQSRPEPPEQLCVEESGDCSAADDGGGVGVAGSKKWNPGHYVKIQGNSGQSDRQDYFSAVTRKLSKTQDSPKIRGAQVKYAWGMLEPRLGNYDWAPVYEHLEYLSARGKKMILAIDTKCFGTDCGSLAPSDLSSEVFKTPREKPTQIIEIWEKRNMDLFIRFWQALGAEFDSNPDVEMIVGSESTPSLQGANPANFSKSGYAAQLKRMYTAQASAFPSTNVVAMVNFLSNQVADLIEHAYSVGAGRGMPDLFESDGSYVFRGECRGGECGARDYRGRVPHFGLISHGTLVGNHGSLTDSPREIIDYGLPNKITHFSWVPSESGEDSWSNIINQIETRNPNGHTACPTSYSDCR